jgi:hypothetical protein
MTPVVDDDGPPSEVGLGGSSPEPQASRGRSHRRSWATAVLILALLVLIGYLSRPETTTWPLPSYDPAMSGSPGATITGVTEPDLENRCLYLRNSADLQIALVWPPGHHARENPLHVFGPEGSMAFEHGEEITLSGHTLPHSAGGGPESGLLEPGSRRCLEGADIAFLVSPIRE